MQNCHIKDAEWCASDKIAVVLENGEIHISDAMAPKLSQHRSVLCDLEVPMTFDYVLPRLLTAKGSFQLKFELCNRYFLW